MNIGQITVAAVAMLLAAAETSWRMRRRQEPSWFDTGRITVTYALAWCVLLWKAVG